jgi:RNA polymerase sigma-70 factor (ECF subfamily)
MNTSCATDAFVENRQRLFGLAYRMLGSVAEAEDAVQEAYLRWRETDSAQVENAAAWLVTTTTRLCIDRGRSAQMRREKYVGLWLPEPLVEPLGTSGRDTAALADSLSMAFMLMLDSLAPVDRAVFLLREAFDYEYEDIARIVDRREAACRQIVSRAKRSLASQRPVDSAAPPRAEELVQRFLAASRTGALPDLLALLTDDVVLYSDGGGKMPAARRPIVTADRVARFFVGIRRFAPPTVETALVRVNGQPGFVVRAGGRVDRVVTLAFAADKVRAVFIVRNPDKLARVEA